jgi:hypothetical protein
MEAVYPDLIAALPKSKDPAGLSGVFLFSIDFSYSFVKMDSGKILYVTRTSPGRLG